MSLLQAVAFISTALTFLCFMKLKNQLIHLFQLAHLDDLDFILAQIHSFDGVLGNHYFFESQLLRFGDAIFNARHRSNFSAQAYLASKANLLRHGRILVTRNQRGADRQI
jgi:hypothetical protein